LASTELAQCETITTTQGQNHSGSSAARAALFSRASIRIRVEIRIRTFKFGTWNMEGGSLELCNSVWAEKATDTVYFRTQNILCKVRDKGFLEIA